MLNKFYQVLKIARTKATKNHILLNDNLKSGTNFRSNVIKGHFEGNAQANYDMVHTNTITHSNVNTKQWLGMVRRKIFISCEKVARAFDCLGLGQKGVLF